LPIVVFAELISRAAMIEAGDPWMPRQACAGGALDRIGDLLHELPTIDWPRAMGWNGI